MSTYRFPWRGTVGLVGSYSELAARIWARLRERDTSNAERPLYSALDIRPTSDDQAEKLPVAHRYSA